MTINDIEAGTKIGSRLNRAIMKIEDEKVYQEAYNAMRDYQEWLLKILAEIKNAIIERRL